MCLLCDDEKAYQAYMNYLDAMERQGKVADPDKAMDAVLDQLEASELTRPKQDNPANDKTLYPTTTLVRPLRVSPLMSVTSVLIW